MHPFAQSIRPIVQAELQAAGIDEARGHFDTAFRHLERAHVLGQRATREHLRVHWRMLRFALAHRLAAQAFGQTWRLIAAAILTPLGLVPAGNTGGADVSAWRRMPVPIELQRLIDAARSRAGRSGAAAVGSRRGRR